VDPCGKTIGAGTDDGNITVCRGRSTGSLRRLPTFVIHFHE